MLSDDSRREGLLVISAWIETDHEQPLRAKITCRPATAEQLMHPYEYTVEEVVDSVRTWLDELTGTNAVTEG